MQAFSQFGAYCITWHLFDVGGRLEEAFLVVRVRLQLVQIIRRTAFEKVFRLNVKVDEISLI